MKPEKDAYGKELWAYLNGQDVKGEIVEKDDGFIAISEGPVAYFGEYKDWSETDKKVIKFAKGKVLDIGCGAGRHSLYLQKKGYHVLGIDNSPLAVRVCRKRGLKKVKNMGIEQLAGLKGPFDTILMLGNNFGLFGGYNKAKRLLKQMHKITSDQAVIIAESHDPYQTKHKTHLDYHKFNRKRNRMSGQLKLRVRFDKYIGDWFDYLLVSKEEMEDILKGTGWEVNKYLDSKKSSYVALIRKENVK